MYIPALNTLLWIACSGVVLFFQTSTRMEAAYGLAITVTMLMTTILLYLLAPKQEDLFLGTVHHALFAAIEGFSFISSATKFFHGGYVPSY